MFKLGAALVAGCSIIAKPAEETPLSTLLLAEINITIANKKNLMCR